jgi:hypothetical protein
MGVTVINGELPSGNKLFGGFKHFFVPSWLMIIGLIYWLIGGLEHDFYFPFQIWDSPSQLTHIFQDG